jgi:phosphatidate cytidylyltransferase
MIRFQLSHLMWTLVTVLLVVVQLKSLATTAFAGLFWFFFPMATVVMNDVSAYFCGITFGRKFITAPFLSLSPNKTWEGFIGAAVLTVIFAFFFPWLLAQFQWFTCPTDDLYLMPYAQLTKLACTPNAVFLPQQYTLPFWLQPFFSSSTVTLLPIQLHGIAYGLFASLVAPFGGFFASAVKRGYGIKDFETLFPGHGGVMDRMDCQLLMLSFTWVHYETFIVQKTLSVARIVAALALLSPQERQAVLVEVIFSHLLTIR